MKPFNVEELRHRTGYMTSGRVAIVLPDFD